MTSTGHAAALPSDIGGNGGHAGSSAANLGETPASHLRPRAPGDGTTSQRARQQEVLIDMKEVRITRSSSSDNHDHTSSSSSHNLVSSMEEVVRTLGTMEQVIRTIVEDNKAGVSRVNCYRVLQKYACQQVKIRTLEAKVRMLEEKLSNQINIRSLEAKVKMLEERINDPDTSVLRTLSTDSVETVSSNPSFLKPSHQEELIRKAKKLERIKKEREQRELEEVKKANHSTATFANTNARDSPGQSSLNIIALSSSFVETEGDQEDEDNDDENSDDSNDDASARTSDQSDDSSSSKRYSEAYQNSTDSQPSIERSSDDGHLECEAVSIRGTFTLESSGENVASSSSDDDGGDDDDDESQSSSPSKHSSSSSQPSNTPALRIGTSFGALKNLSTSGEPSAALDKKGSPSSHQESSNATSPSTTSVTDDSHDKYENGEVRVLAAAGLPPKMVEGTAMPYDQTPRTPDILKSSKTQEPEQLSGEARARAAMGLPPKSNSVTQITRPSTTPELSGEARALAALGLAPKRDSVQSQDSKEKPSHPALSRTQSASVESEPSGEARAMAALGMTPKRDSTQSVKPAGAPADAELSGEARALAALGLPPKRGSVQSHDLSKTHVSTNAQTAAAEPKLSGEDRALAALGLAPKRGSTQSQDRSTPPITSMEPELSGEDRALVALGLAPKRGSTQSQDRAKPPITSTEPELSGEDRALVALGLAPKRGSTQSQDRAKPPITSTESELSGEDRALVALGLAPKRGSTQSQDQSKSPGVAENTSTEQELSGEARALAAMGLSPKRGSVQSHEHAKTPAVTSVPSALTEPELSGEARALAAMGLAPKRMSARSHDGTPITSGFSDSGRGGVERAASAIVASPKKGPRNYVMPKNLQLTESGNPITFSSSLHSEGEQVKAASDNMSRRSSPSLPQECPKPSESKSVDGQELSGEARALAAMGITKKAFSGDVKQRGEECNDPKRGHSPKPPPLDGPLSAVAQQEPTGELRALAAMGKIKPSFSMGSQKVSEVVMKTSSHDDLLRGVPVPPKSIESGSVSDESDCSSLSEASENDAGEEKESENISESDNSDEDNCPDAASACLSRCSARSEYAVEMRGSAIQRALGNITLPPPKPQTQVVDLDNLLLGAGGDDSFSTNSNQSSAVSQESSEDSDESSDESRNYHVRPVGSQDFMDASHSSHVFEDESIRSGSVLHNVVIGDAASNSRDFSRSDYAMEMRESAIQRALGNITPTKTSSENLGSQIGEEESTGSSFEDNSEGSSSYENVVGSKTTKSAGSSSVSTAVKSPGESRALQAILNSQSSTVQRWENESENEDGRSQAGTISLQIHQNDQQPTAYMGPGVALGDIYLKPPTNQDNPYHSSFDRDESDDEAIMMAAGRYDAVSNEEIIESTPEVPAPRTRRQRKGSIAMIAAPVTAVASVGVLAVTGVASAGIAVTKGVAQVGASAVSGVANAGINAAVGMRNYVMPAGWEGPHVNRNDAEEDCGEDSGAPRQRRQRKGSIAMISAPVIAVGNAGISAVTGVANAGINVAVGMRNYVMPSSWENDINSREIGPEEDENADPAPRGRRQRKGSIAMITAPVTVMANAGLSVASGVANAGINAAVGMKNYVMPASWEEGSKAMQTDDAVDGEAPRPRRQRKGSIAMISAPVTAVASGVVSGMSAMSHYVMPSGWDLDDDEDEAAPVQQGEQGENSDVKKKRKRRKFLKVVAFPLLPLIMLARRRKKRRAKKSDKGGAVMSPPIEQDECSNLSPLPCSPVSTSLPPNTPPYSPVSTTQQYPDSQSDTSMNGEMRALAAMKSSARLTTEVGNNEKSSQRPQPVSRGRAGVA